MAIEISYTKAKNHLASYMDRVVTNHETIIIRREDKEGVVQKVALLDAAELSGLLEAVHLLSSCKNAERLFSALESAKSKSVAPSSIEELEHRYGLTSD